MIDAAAACLKEAYGRPTTILVSPLNMELWRYMLNGCRWSTTLHGTYIVRRDGKVVAWRRRNSRLWIGEQPHV